MKKLLIWIATVTFFASSIFAQDLDIPKENMPKSDVKETSKSIYNEIIENMLQKEQELIARRGDEWSWIQWGYWRDTDYGWATSSDIHYEFWDQLTIAEFTAARMAFDESWNRVLASGLN